MAADAAGGGEVARRAPGGWAGLLRRPGFRALCLGLWAAGWTGVLYLSLAPLRELPFGASDKTLHLAGYALMTLLSAGFCHAPGALLALAVATVAGSAAIESVQGLLPYRSFELADLAANAAGAALGAAAALAWVSLLVRPRRGGGGLSRRPLPS